jgi:hypothetical protein
VQNDIEQGTVDFEPAVVVNETQLPEPVHEKADSRTSSADHFGASVSRLIFGTRASGAPLIAVDISVYQFAPSFNSFNSAG